MFSQAKTLSSAWDCIPIHFSFHFSLHSLLSLRLIIVNPDDRLREIICKFFGVVVVVVVVLEDKSSLRDTLRQSSKLNKVTITRHRTNF